MRDDGLDQTLRPTSSNSSNLSTEVDLLRADGEARYLDLSQLGVGGMGEVRLVKDRRIARDVALKRMRSTFTNADDTTRFLREVRVQGQLDHPSVVPVYDLGVTAEGAPWFTMKRVRGLTLHDVLRLLKEKDPATTARFTRWRLLSIFNTVCQCIDSAHAREVLHRDLKPGNVMLGEFGEVHVLDWGLARVKGRDETPSAPRPITVDDGLPKTELGLAMGTPGYMSPEQAEGLTHQLDERTDVYALGVILHELLYLSPLHDALTPQEKLISTKRRELPTETRADIAPELDAIWRKACAAEPKDRFPTARALAEAVERFLEGERDEARRKQLAEVQLTLADQALTDTHEGRGRALQALGRALALDPTNAAALRKLSALLAEPPKQMPPEAQKRLEALASTRARQTLESLALRLGIWMLCVLGAIALVGTKSVPLVAFVLLVLGSVTGVTLLLARRRDVAKLQFPAALGGVLCLGALALTLGPLVVVPTLAATQAMLFASNAPLWHRRWMVALSVLVVVVPALFSPWGSTMELQHGALVLTSPMLPFEGAATPLVVLLLSLLPVATPAVLVGRLHDAFVDAERGVVVQAAALQQLIPE